MHILCAPHPGDGYCNSRSKEECLISLPEIVERAAEVKAQNTAEGWDLCAFYIRAKDFDASYLWRGEAGENIQNRS